MISYLNLSLVEGRLTHDPELLYTKNGAAMCKFNIAVNQTFKSHDKSVNEVSYISIDTWNKVAECCAKYLKKGNMIRVKGRLKQNLWQDKEVNKKSILAVSAATIDFLSYPKKTKPYEQDKPAF